MPLECTPRTAWLQILLMSLDVSCAYLFHLHAACHVRPCARTQTPSFAHEESVHLTQRVIGGYKSARCNRQSPAFTGQRLHAIAMQGGGNQGGATGAAKGAMEGARGGQQTGGMSGASTCARKLRIHCALLTCTWHSYTSHTTYFGSSATLSHALCLCHAVCLCHPSRTALPAAVPGPRGHVHALSVHMAARLPYRCLGMHHIASHPLTLTLCVPPAGAAKGAMAGGREGEYGGAGYGGDSKQVGQQAGANTGYGAPLLVPGKCSVAFCNLM